MAKVSRSVLKEIVKECLLEILFEGIDSEPGYDEEPIREARRPRASRPSSKRDLATAVQQRQTQANPRTTRQVKKPVIQEAVSELTQDPLMASIFTDTAQTTLQEQNQATGRRTPADNAAAVVDNAENVSDIFEGAGNWAAIVFGEAE